MLVIIIPRFQALCQDGNAVFLVNNTKGTPRISIGVGSDDEPVFTVFDTDNKKRIQITCNDETGPSVALADKTEQARLHLRFTEKHDFPVIVLVGPDGKESSITIGLPGGSPILSGTDEHGIKVFQGL